jgi:hypothetical protein
MTTPGIGDIVYLASALIKVTPTVVQTYPDTPSQYSADLKVIGDPGGWDLSALAGPSGPAGNALFCLRNAYDVDPTRPIVNSPAQLPTDLTNTAADIGLYWPIDTLDAYGHVVMTNVYVWYGTDSGYAGGWRTLMTGSVGPPGPVPQVQVSVVNITPQTLPAYPDTTSFIATSGPTLQPSWVFNLAVPAGPVGPPGGAVGIHLAAFPDVDVTSTAPTDPSVLGFAGNLTTFEQPLWQPLAVNPAVLQTYSMPQSAFTPFIGVTQQALVGTFTIPPPGALPPVGPIPYDWTPIVWGHLSAGAASGQLSQQIGVQVLLNATWTGPGSPPAPGHGSIGGLWSGQLIGRGLGNRGGEVNIMPHYSTPGTAPTAAISPTNNMAVVAANTPATLSVCLWNDGHLGNYAFYPTSSPPPLTQLFVNIDHATTNTLTNLHNVTVALGNIPGEIKQTLQDAMDTVAAQLHGLHLPASVTQGVTTISDTIASDLAATLTNFESLLNSVASDLGLTGVADPITAVGDALSAVTATVSADTQTAIDTVGNALGLTGTGLTAGPVATLISDTHTALQTLATDLGLTGVTDLVASVQSGLRSLTGTIATGVQTSIDTVANLLGLPGTGNTPTAVADVIGELHTVLTAAATDLGLTQLPNPFTAVANQLATWQADFQAGLATLTSDIQHAVDQIANAFGVAGTGVSAATVTNALNTLQPALDDLAAELGLLSISNLVSELTAFTAPVTTPIQAAFDALTTALNAGVGHTRSEVIGILNNFQSALDGVGAALGMAAGATVDDIFTALADITGFVAGTIGTPVQNALNTLGALLGVSGAYAGLDAVLLKLEPLLGNRLSKFSTDAQLFIMVVPISPQPLTFIGVEGAP